MAAMFLVSLILCAVQWQGGQRAEGASLPYPSINITHSAKLLKLECTLPPPTISWSQIFKVSLFKHPDFRDPTRNVSLVNMTSLMTQPKMANLPADANVTFTGRWDKAVSLTLTMPLSEAERGRYYCTAEHKIPADYSVYSTEVVVDEESVLSGRSGGELPFVFRVIPVDRVHVTWLNPGSAHDFTEASVSREEMDRSGKPLTAASTLCLMGSGAMDFVRTGDVLLHKMSDIGGNSSVTLYVDPAPCSARCQYGCRVSFRDCVWPDARHCVCGQAEEAASAADACLIVAIVFAVIFSIAFSVFLVVYFVKHNICTRRVFRKKSPNKKEDNPMSPQGPDGDVPTQETPREPAGDGSGAIPKSSRRVEDLSSPLTHTSPAGPNEALPRNRQGRVGKSEKDEIPEKEPLIVSIIENPSGGTSQDGSIAAGTTDESVAAGNDGTRMAEACTNSETSAE